MPQIFRPYADTVARFVLIAIVFVPLAAIALAYGVAWSPYMTRENITVEQPVPFSHKHHVGGLGLDCRYCHTSVETSPVASLPPTHTCMTCHSQLFTTAPMLAPIRDSLAQGQPIRWKRVNRLPDYVYFDHSIHIAKGVGCQTCHGDVADMPLMRQAASLQMAWCLDCHRNPAPNLRPRSEIFNTQWAPPKDRYRDDLRLVELYQIHNEHLTDCSVCHR